MKFKYIVDSHLDTKTSPTIAGALGVRKEMDFPYKSQASLDEALKTMSLFDMQDLAIKLGVKPNANRGRMKKNVSEKFAALRKIHGSAVERSEAPQEVREFDPNDYV